MTRQRVEVTVLNLASSLATLAAPRHGLSLISYDCAIVIRLRTCHTKFLEPSTLECFRSCGSFEQISSHGLITARGGGFAPLEHSAEAGSLFALRAWHPCRPLNPKRLAS